MAPRRHSGALKMGLLSRKKKDELPEDAFRWATNAPAHWPPVYSNALHPDEIPSANMIMFAGNAQRSFNQVPGCPVKVAAFLRSYLDYRGIVEAPFQFEDSGVKYPVFMYPVANSDAAARFAGLWEYFSNRGMTPVYYSPNHLPQASYIASPFEKLWISHFSNWQGEAPRESCSMWWASESNAPFSGTACALDIDRTMRALDGYSTYILGEIGRKLGKLPEDSRRVHLPEEMTAFSVEGPEEMFMIISASREKGIGVHFPSKSTPQEYRDAFWHCFAMMAEEFRKEAIKHGLPIDPPQDREGIGHWEAVMNLLKHKKVGEGGVNEIGLIFGHDSK